MNACAAT